MLRKLAVATVLALFVSALLFIPAARAERGQHSGREHFGHEHRDRRGPVIVVPPPRLYPRGNPYYYYDPATPECSYAWEYHWVWNGYQYVWAPEWTRYCN